MFWEWCCKLSMSQLDNIQNFRCKYCSCQPCIGPQLVEDVTRVSLNRRKVMSAARNVELMEWQDYAVLTSRKE